MLDYVWIAGYVNRFDLHWKTIERWGKAWMGKLSIGKLWKMFFLRLSFLVTCFRLVKEEAMNENHLFASVGVRGSSQNRFLAHNHKKTCFWVSFRFLLFCNSVENWPKDESKTLWIMNESHTSECHQLADFLFIIYGHKKRRKIIIMSKRERGKLVKNLLVEQGLRHSLLHANFMLIIDRKKSLWHWSIKLSDKERFRWPASSFPVG